MAFGQEIASFYASIGADSSGLQKGLEDSKKGMSGLQSTVSTLQGMVSTAFIAAGAAAVAFAASIANTGIQFDAMKEQAQVAFTTMLGSGEAAQGMLNELQAFAAKTPFEFPDLIKASQRLMAMGFAATDVIPTLTAIGDAVAALGGTAETVDRVTTALGQMNAKGKASGEEMMQLTEAGIPAWQMLADKIGVSIPEAMKAVTAGSVSAGTAISAITEGIESKFGGMMEKQSTTWNGIISNIKDGFQQMSGTIMKPFFEFAKTQLALVAKAVGDFSKMLANGENMIDAFTTAIGDILPPEMLDAWVKFIDLVEGAYEVVKAILKPIGDAISKFVKWQDVLLVLGSVLGAAVLPVLGSVVVAIAGFLAPIAAAIAEVAALRYAWDHNFLGIKTVTQDALSAIAKWFAGTSIWKGSINETLYGPNGIQPNIIIWSRATRNRIAEWVQWGKDKFEQFKGDVVRIFTNWKDIIITTFHDWIDPVMDMVGKWAIGVKNEFNHLIGWFTGDAGGTFSDMKTKAIAIWDSMFDWWKEHVDPWVQYGKDIVQGLWDGMVEIWKKLSDWFSGVWGDLTTRFKNFFGIASPSTLFAGYGQNMMEGLANGIDTGKSLVDASMAAVSTSIDAATPKLNNYYLDLLNAKNAQLALASMPTLPPAPVLYHTTPGGAANGSEPQPSSGGAVHPTSGGPQYKSLSSAIFDLFGANSNAVQQITSFAGDAYSAITAAGQLQGSSAASLAYKEIGTGNAGGDTVGRVISAVMALIDELQRRGVDNQVNTKAIQKLIDALSQQGGNSNLGALVGALNGLR